MASFTTSSDEERLIDQIRQKGLQQPNLPKLAILRLALALSIRINQPIEQSWEKMIGEKGVDYKIERITGIESENEDGESKNLEKALQAVLSIKEQKDLFADHSLFITCLKAHIRRGLNELKTSWRSNHSFAAFLYQEFSNILTKNIPETAEKSPAHSDEELLIALKEIGIDTEFSGQIVGPRSIRYQIKLNDINQFDKLKKSQEKLSILLGLEDVGVFIKNTSTPKIVAIDIPKASNEWWEISFKDLISWSEASVDLKGQLYIWLGKDVLGNDYSTDLSTCPHLLIGGTTGSGKSILIHNIIASLSLLNNEDTLQLALIDPKYVEFSQYSGLPNLYGGRVINSANEAEKCLNTLVTEMDVRNKKFAQLGVKNYSELPRSYKLPRIVVIIEELADLLHQSIDIEVPIVRLAQKARSVGIHLVLATQRPDSKTFTGLLRSNIPSRIALKVQKYQESEIIIGESGAERLLGKGDLLLKLPSEQNSIRLHCANISSNDIEKLVNNIGV